MDGILHLVLPINFLRQVHTTVSIIDLYVDDLSFTPASEAQQIFGMNSRMEFNFSFVSVTSACRSEWRRPSSMQGTCEYTVRFINFRTDFS